MPMIFLTKEERLSSRLASYIYGELKARRIRQADLAHRMGISQPTLSLKIRNKRFSFEDFVAVVDFFKPDEKEINRLVGFDE